MSWRTSLWILCHNAKLIQCQGGRFQGPENLLTYNLVCFVFSFKGKPAAAKKDKTDQPQSVQKQPEKPTEAKSSDSATATSSQKKPESKPPEKVQFCQIVVVLVLCIFVVETKH